MIADLFCDGSGGREGISFESAIEMKKPFSAKTLLKWSGMGGGGGESHRTSPRLEGTSPAGVKYVASPSRHDLIAEFNMSMRAALDKSRLSSILCAKVLRSLVGNRLQGIDKYHFRGHQG